MKMCVNSASEFVVLGNKLGLDIRSERYSGSERSAREVAGGSGGKNKIRSDIPEILEERLSAAQTDAVPEVARNIVRSQLYLDSPL